MLNHWGRKYQNERPTLKLIDTFILTERAQTIYLVISHWFRLILATFSLSKAKYSVSVLIFKRSYDFLLLFNVNILIDNVSLHVDMFVSFFSAAKFNYSDRTYTLLRCLWIKQLSLQINCYWNNLFCFPLKRQFLSSNVFPYQKIKMNNS